MFSANDLILDDLGTTLHGHAVVSWYWNRKIKKLSYSTSRSHPSLYSAIMAGRATMAPANLCEQKIVPFSKNRQKGPQSAHYQHFPQPGLLSPQSEPDIRPNPPSILRDQSANMSPPLRPACHVLAIPTQSDTLWRPRPCVCVFDCLYMGHSHCFQPLSQPKPPLLSHPPCPRPFPHPAAFLPP